MDNQIRFMQHENNKFTKCSGTLNVHKMEIKSHMMLQVVMALTSYQMVAVRVDMMTGDFGNGGGGG